MSALATAAAPRLRGALSAALAFAAGASCGRSDAAHVALGATRALTAPGGNGAAATLAVAPGGRRAAAWVTAPGGGSDGRVLVAVAGADGAFGAPAEVRDPIGPIEAHGEAPPKLAWAPDGALYLLYAVGKEVPGRRFPLSALRFARSADGGRTWGAPAGVTDAATFGSYNFHSLVAARGDTVYAAWLDGRAGRSAAYVTRSTDGGRTWAANVRVHGGEACPCCRTAVAAGGGDTVYAAWRRVGAGDVREVVVARSADGGRTWAEPVNVQRDGWVIAGCPHAGPSLRVDARGAVHAAWWTGKPGAAGVFYARSGDGGRTFDAPVPLGTADRSRAAHVQLAVADGAGAPRVLVAWDDGTRRTPRVLLRASRDGGRTFGAPAPVSADDVAGTYPVLAVEGGRLSVAWSEESAAHLERAARHGMDHEGPKARMPLPTVGERRVMVREGVVQ